MERPPAKLFDIVRNGIQLKGFLFISLCVLCVLVKILYLLRTCLSHTIT